MVAGPISTPLLSGELTTNITRLLFAVLGFASSILWNQLLLSVGLLVQLFGDHAIGVAATSQNALCTAAMVVLTFAPHHIAVTARGDDRRERSIALCRISVALMLVLGLALTASLLIHRLPLALFVLLVCINGVATGTTQVVSASLGGMLSGRASAANGALLVGEAAAPLLTTLMAAGATYAESSDTYLSTVISLILPLVALCAALAALQRLSRDQAQLDTLPSECNTMGTMLSDVSSDAQSVLKRRMHQVRSSVVATCAICVVWVFFLSSVPYIADGLCSTDTQVANTAGDVARCIAHVSPLMVGASNVAAFVGRWGGTFLPVGTPRVLVREAAVLFVGVGSLTLLAEGPGEVPLVAPLGAATVGLGLSFGLTLWTNVLLMRLSRAGHASADNPHSLKAQCPVAAQMTWVAIQSGCMVGSVLSLFVVRR